MSRPELRSDVISLLLDVENPNQRDPLTGRWKHMDGHPFTREEMDLAMSATREEFEAYYAQMLMYSEARIAQASAPGDIANLLLPYLAQLPPSSSINDVLPLLTPEELAEFERLCDLAEAGGFSFPTTGSDE